MSHQNDTILVAGLGNPGAHYSATRHNLGFMVLKRLAAAHEVSVSQRKFRSRWGQGRTDERDILLVRPSTYMNLSGLAIGQWVKHLGKRMSSLIVIHDDLDTDFGRIRVRRGGGHGGHRGVRSIIETLGTADFVRVKIGIGRPGGQPPELFVLQPFAPEEQRYLPAVIRRGCEAVEAIIGESLEAAMNRFNTPFEYVEAPC